MLSENNYRQSLQVKTNIAQAFAALTVNIDKWWSTVEGPASEIDNIFKVSFGKESYWKFKVLEIQKPESILWECVESHQNHHLTGIDEEWKNSKLHWKINNMGEHVIINLLHEGLLSTGVCYDVCSKAWDFYLLDSLKSYLEKGAGKPG